MYAAGNCTGSSCFSEMQDSKAGCELQCWKWCAKPYRTKQSRTKQGTAPEWAFYATSIGKKEVRKARPERQAGSSSLADSGLIRLTSMSLLDACRADHSGSGINLRQLQTTLSVLSSYANIWPISSKPYQYSEFFPRIHKSTTAELKIVLTEILADHA